MLEPLFMKLQACNFIKKRLPLKLAKFLRTPFSQNTSVVTFETKRTHASAANLLHTRIGNLDWNDSNKKELNIFLLQLLIYYIRKSRLVQMKTLQK